MRNENNGNGRNGNGEDGDENGNGNDDGDGNDDEQNGEQNDKSGHNQRKWRIPDQKVPIFHGNLNEDIESWFFALKNCFQINEVPKEKWVQYTGSYVRDNAMYQYRLIIRQYPNIKWASFAQKFWDAFIVEDYQQTLRVKLLALKQEKSFHEYLSNFNKLMSRIENMSEPDKIHLFC